MQESKRSYDVDGNQKSGKYITMKPTNILGIICLVHFFHSHQSFANPVDGRNPAPVEVGSLSHYTGISTPVVQELSPDF